MSLLQRGVPVRQHEMALLFDTCHFDSVYGVRKFPSITHLY